MLPEDDANREIATGFQLHVHESRQRRMQVLRVAGGWSKVLKEFKKNHVAQMEENPRCFMVLLVDFDRSKVRLKKAKAAIPESLAERVFVLGTWSRPEDLKKAKLGTYETIGSLLADECGDLTETTWGHRLLKHNAPELLRLKERARGILFGDPAIPS